jgi:FixJ family two-component response regulator
LKGDKFTVHVVDPDRAIGDGFAVLLSTYGVVVRSYPDAETFLESRPPVSAQRCCLIVEADLPGLSGPALIQRLLDECDDLAVVLLVSTSSPELIGIAKSSNQIGVVEKPFVHGTLIDELVSRGLILDVSSRQFSVG